MPDETSPLLPGGDASTAEDRRQQPKARNSRLRELFFFTWALLATAGFIIIAVWFQHTEQTVPPAQPESPPTKRNLVFMVSDGMGPASLALTRNYRQRTQGLDISDTLTLDKHFWGSSRTRSDNSLVTDSAAGATAFSCAHKSYNGAISVLPDHTACGSVMEAAKRAGYTTGLVVTTDITDATPACFASHALRRDMQDLIALQEIGDSVLGRSVDLMLGGGRCHFLPNSTEGGCRLDNIDVTKRAQKKHGWNYIDSRKGFDALKGGNNVQLPLLGLFAPNDIPFEIDRRNMNDIYPSLSEMATSALRALEKATADSEQGFFLMIEGSRIDHAGHFNDPAAQVHEVIEYDHTFQAVLDFIAQSETETVLVATSDHETGGLATAIQEPGHLPVYDWYPQVLHRANASCELLAARLQQHVAANWGEEGRLKTWINKNLIIPGLGFTDATDSELTLLARDTVSARDTLAAMISRRAHIGWSTHGHTAVDVNIYSSGGPGTNAIRGNVENTDVGKFLRSYLDVDVEPITKELREKGQDIGAGLAAVKVAGIAGGQGYHAAEEA